MGTHVSIEDGSLVIFLLGRFRVRVGDRVVDEQAWRLRKAKHLLTLLALTPNRRLHREYVTELLWPNLDAQAAANNFRRALHHARRTLAPRPAPRDLFLRLEGAEIALVAPGSIWVDVHAFVEAAARARRQRTLEAYREALALYGGELVPEARYDEWLATHRERLHNESIDLLLSLARLYEARGDRSLAIQTFRDLLNREPANEEAHVGLMRLYGQSGKRHLALRQYQELSKVLRRELDADPSLESKQLYQSLLLGRGKTDATDADRDDPTDSEVAVAIELSPGPPDETFVPPTRSPPDDSRPHNLPVSLTSFIGRRSELTTVTHLVRRHRLVTLTGIGGAGKSRLALESARALLEEYEHGAWLINLSSLSDTALLAGYIALALGINVQGARPPIDVLTAALKSRNLLLVLDNCEHATDACRALLHRLLQACPGVHVIVTSRRPTRVMGEVVWTVPPMQLPDLRRPLPPLSEIEQFEAVRLFVERAQTVQPEFTLNQHNAEYVVDICRKLDGNPLAIELAAARTQVLSPAQIAALLKDRFQLLTSGSATASSRQRTLRAVVDWSYESLQPTERDLFNRLSVFVGGFSLEAAAALCDDGSALIPLLNGLTSLAELSLIYIEGDAGGAARYLIPETLRQYALARLSESGQTEEMRRRHATYFLSLVERANEHIATSKQGVWIDRLERESDNLRTALHWSFDVGDTEMALRLGGALWRYWLALGHVVFAQGHHGRAAQLAARIYDLVTTIDDQRGLAAYLELSSLVAMECGKPGHAIRLFAASTSLREQVGYTLEERDQARSESCLQSLRALLPQEQFAAEWELGSTMKSADAALEAQQVLDSIKGP